MPSIPWYSAVLISIPQTFLFIQIGYRLLNLKPRISTAVLVSVVIAVYSLLVRGSAMNYVINLCIIVIVISLMISFLDKMKFRYCLLATLLGEVIYGIFETIIVFILSSFFSFPFEQISSNPILQFKGFTPIAIIMILILAFIIKKQAVLYDLNRREK